MELTETSKTQAATGSTTDETMALENNKRGCCTKKQEKYDACCSRKSSVSCCSITIKLGCGNIKIGDRAASETSCLQRPRKCVDLCQQGCCVTILCDGMRKRICLTIICSKNDANLNKFCDEPVGFCKKTDTEKNCCKLSNAPGNANSASPCHCGDTRQYCDNTDNTVVGVGCCKRTCCISPGCSTEDEYNSGAEEGDGKPCCSKNRRYDVGSSAEENCCSNKCCRSLGCKNKDCNSGTKGEDEKCCCKDSENSCSNVSPEKKKCCSKKCCTLLGHKSKDVSVGRKEEEDKPCCEEFKSSCCGVGSPDRNGTADRKNCCSKTVSFPRCHTITINYAGNRKAGCCVSHESNEKSDDRESCCPRQECGKDEEDMAVCCQESKEGCCGTGRSEDEMNRHGKNNCCSNPGESGRCSTTVTPHCEAPKQGATQENNKGNCQGGCSNEPKNYCYVCKHSDEEGEANETDCCNKSRKNADCCKALGNGVCCKLLIKCCCKPTCCDTTGEKDSQITNKDCNCKPSGLTECQCECNEECTSKSERDRDDCCNTKNTSKISLVKSECCCNHKDGCCSVKGCVVGEVNPGKRHCCCCISCDNECGYQIDVGDEGCYTASTNVGCCRVIIKCYGGGSSSISCSCDKDSTCKKGCCRSAVSDDITMKNCCVTSQDCHCSGKGCFATRAEKCCKSEVQCCCIHEQGCCTVQSDKDESQITKECHCQKARCGDYYTCCCYKKTDTNTGCCFVSLTLGCCTITIESCYNCCNCKKACCQTSVHNQTTCQTQKNCCCTTADCNDKCDDTCGCKGNKNSDCCNSSRASGCCKA